MSNTPVSPPPSPWTNSVPKDYKETFEKRKIVTEFADPCAAASKASMDCLNRHDYNRNKCLDFFQAYRDCKAAWIEQRKQDGRDGKRVT